ncbi:hypothetical protein BDQ17DRAFT_1421486 [Cyathus striatus]|nr:hypothetical protein BDQ17DRAFT_1421486 [Cyathus striatus]
MRVLVGGTEKEVLVKFLVHLESVLPAAERQKWRDRSTQALADAGYTSAAADMISRKRKGKFTLSPETYAKVLRAANGTGEIRDVLDMVRERDWRLGVQEGKRGVLGVGRGKRRGQWEEKLADNAGGRRPSTGKKINQRTVFKDPSSSSKPHPQYMEYDAVKQAAVAYGARLPPPPGVSAEAKDSK